MYSKEREHFCNDCLVKKAEVKMEPAHDLISVAPDDYVAGRTGDVLSQHGICQFRRVDTDDWWSFDGKTNTCKCRSCAKRGIY